MADAFVQTGTGEVRLQDIMALKDKAFWSHTEQAMLADAHEEKHPGVTVRRPWETEAQHKERVKARKMTSSPEPTLGMTRDRAEPELARQKAMLGGLGLDHPHYDKLFPSITRYINELEGVLGLAKTRYVKGTVPQKPSEPEIDPELKEKLKKYVGLREDLRRASIEKGEDVALLTLIRDKEVLPALRALAVVRIEQVKSGQMERGAAI